MNVIRDLCTRSAAQRCVSGCTVDSLLLIRRGGAGGYLSSLSIDSLRNTILFTDRFRSWPSDPPAMGIGLSPPLPGMPLNLV